jgi:hypothetical protein
LREATPAAARRAVRVRGFDALDRELFDTTRAGASAFR